MGQLVVDQSKMSDYIMQLNADVAALKAEVHHLSKVVESQDQKLDRIMAVLERHKTIVGMFSALAALISAALVHIIEKIGVFK